MVRIRTKLKPTKLEKKETKIMKDLKNYLNLMKLVRKDFK